MRCTAGDSADGCRVEARYGLLSWLSVTDMQHITLHDDFLRDKESHLKGMFSLPLLATWKTSSLPHLAAPRRAVSDPHKTVHRNVGPGVCAHCLHTHHMSQRTDCQHCTAGTSASFAVCKARGASFLIPLHHPPAITIPHGEETTCRTEARWQRLSCTQLKYALRAVSLCNGLRSAAPAPRVTLFLWTYSSHISTCLGGDPARRFSSPNRSRSLPRRCLRENDIIKRAWGGFLLFFYKPWRATLDVSGIWKPENNYRGWECQVFRQQLYHYTVRREVIALTTAGTTAVTHTLIPC